MIIKQTIVLLTISFTTLAFSMTPDEQLLDASGRGDMQAVKKALTSGAYVNAQFKGGSTALICAASDGHQDMVSLLLDNKADINAQDNDGCTALMSAAFWGFIDTVKLLIDNKADINSKDNHGRTALMYAAQKGHKDVVQLLIINQADLSAPDKYGWTALMYAAVHDHTNIVQLLIDNGADVSAQDNDGRTALMIAAMNSHKATAQLLIDNGANVNTQDTHCDTALMWAVREGHTNIVQLLAAAGADLTGLEKYPEYLKIAQDIRNEVNTVFEALSNRTIKTVLGYSNTAQGFCKLFKERPYLVNARNEDSNTLVHSLVANTEDKQINEPYTLYRFKLLMLIISEYPHMLDLKDKSGYTPITFAIATGNRDVIKVLIEAAFTKSTLRDCLNASGTTELAQLFHSPNSNNSNLKEQT